MVETYLIYENVYVPDGMRAGAMAKQEGWQASVANK